MSMVFRLISTLVLGMLVSFLISLPFASAYDVSASESDSVINNKKAYSLNDFLFISRDPQVVEAFQLMARTQNGRPALDLLVNKKAKVFFKKLKDINRAVKDYDAVSWIGPKGEWVIFINQKHRSAPGTAIAAVIAHEAIHNDTQNSLNEEIVGWHVEGLMWREMKALYPQLESLKAEEGSLVERLNKIALHHESGTLSHLVKQNPGYNALPTTSPGFNNVQARLKFPYSPIYNEAHRELKPLSAN